MTAVLLTLALFAIWWLIGLAVLAAMRAKTESLRVALVAPVLGTAATVLPLFVLSHAGLAMQDCGVPVTIALVVGSAAILVARRPKVHRGIAAVLAICIGNLFLVGWPMLGFGFRWISYANPDMANYALSATQLLHSGLLAPIDLVGLSHNQNYPSVMASLHRIGARPGADITLAAFSNLAGRPAYEVFMPFILALNLCTICGTAALAMQASRRWWAAGVAAFVVAVSPLATFGVLVQLLPQVWGLGLAAALLALLMRRELHGGSPPSLSDVVPISMLTAAVTIVYVELAGTLAFAYGLYVALVVIRRQIDLRVALRLWVPVLIFTAIVLNSYLIRELRFVSSQAGAGIRGVFSGPVTPFDYTLAPSALAGVVGLLKLPASANAPFLQSLIAAAIVLLAATFVGAVFTAFRGVAASVALVSYAALGTYLGLKSSEFGLFKLYMYVQPFLAAAVAVWFARATKIRTLAIAAVPLVLVVALQVRTQQAYVQSSRDDPPGLRHASYRDLLPAFRRFATGSQKPLISVTENRTLAELEATSVGQRPLYYISENLFSPVNSQVSRRNGWRQRPFKLVGSLTERINRFWDNTHASAVLSVGKCMIVLPTGTQTVLNRRSMKEGITDLVARPCGDVRNTLVFTESKLGLGYANYSDLRLVSFYLLENDPFNSGRTMSGFGRYVLFRVLKPSARARFQIDLSTTFIRTRLPPVVVFGKGRVRLPLIGYGSARVFSSPVQLQTIEGQSYALLDMGRDGALPPGRARTGINGLYGGSIHLDPRYLTAWVRNVSLVSAAQYSRLRRPLAIASFPGGLADQDLEYSGIYEDGWVGRRSYAVFAPGAALDLRLRALVPSLPGRQRLQLLVNGDEVADRKVAPGELTLQVPVPASDSPRRVEMLWAAATRLPAPDRRPVSALLQFLGLASRQSP